MTRRFTIRAVSLALGVAVGVIAFRSCVAPSAASVFARGSSPIDRLRLAWEEVHAAPR